MSMMERIMTSLVKLSTSRQFQCTNCNFSGKIKKVEGFAIKLCHKHEDFIWHLPFKIDFFATTNSMIVFIRNFCRTSLVLDRTHFEKKHRKKIKLPNILCFTQISTSGAQMCKLKNIWVRPINFEPGKL